MLPPFTQNRTCRIVRRVFLKSNPENLITTKVSDVTSHWVVKIFVVGEEAFLTSVPETKAY